MVKKVLWPTVVATFLVPAIALSDVGEADFSLRTTQDLYDLCSAPSDHADYAPAHLFLADVLRALERCDEAREHYGAYLRLDDDPGRAEQVRERMARCGL